VRVVLVLLLLTAPPGEAAVYRCGDPDGSLRFTDDPAACREPVPHAPHDVLQSAGSPAAREPAPPGQAGPEGGDGRFRGDLAEIFVPDHAVTEAWEVVREAPSDPARDPELWGAGVRAVMARHYTRSQGPVSQVCSVEIWRFESAALAARAGAQAAIPHWRFLRRGNLLISVRGVTLERERGSTRGVFPACHHLAERTGERASSRLR
jgi:hypothetical protein